MGKSMTREKFVKDFVHYDGNKIYGDLSGSRTIALNTTSKNI